MSCHTWCYKKSEITSSTLKLEIVKYCLQMSLLLYKNLDKKIENKLNVIKDEFNGSVTAFEEHLADYHEPISKLEKYIDRMESGDDIPIFELYDIYSEQAGNSSEVINGSLYEDTNYHDLFRTSYDDEIFLYSLDETLLYIKNNNCCGNTYNNGKEFVTDPIDFSRIEQFWKNYPEGVIYFG